MSVQAGLKAVLDSSNDLSASLCPSFMRTMEFKSEVSEHLSSIVAAEDCHRHAPKAALLHVVRSISFILDVLPVIRTRTRSSSSSHTAEVRALEMSNFIGRSVRDSTSSLTSLFPSGRVL